MRTRARLVAAWGPVLCLAMALCGPAAAQETAFHPEVFVEQIYNSNLLTQPDGEQTSDGITRVAVGLPVDRNWRSGSLSFRYQPSYEWYRDNDALNHDEHRVRLGLTSEPGRRSSLSYGLLWNRTQSQGTIEDPELGDTVLAPRSEQDLFYTNLRYDGNLSRRMSWHTGVEGSRTDYTLLEDPDVDPTTAGLESRSQYAGFLGLDRAVSRKDRFGAEGRWDLYDLESSGEETAAQLSLTWDRSVAESYEVGLRMGAFRRDNEPGEGGAPLESSDESGVTFAAYVAKLFTRSRLDLTARHGPSSGGALVGTSTNTAATLGLSGSPGPRWDWGINSTYTLRSPTDPEAQDSKTLGGAGRVEWRPWPKAALRLAASYTAQTNDGAPEIDTDVFVGSLSLVWYPSGPAGSRGGG